MFDLVERPGAFNIQEVLIHNHSDVTGIWPVVINTPPQRWAYAASFTLKYDPQDPLAAHSRSLIRRLAMHFPKRIEKRRLAVPRLKSCSSRRGQARGSCFGMRPEGERDRESYWKTFMLLQCTLPLSQTPARALPSQAARRPSIFPIWSPCLKSGSMWALTSARRLFRLPRKTLVHVCTHSNRTSESQPARWGSWRTTSCYHLRSPNRMDGRRFISIASPPAVPCCRWKPKE